MKRVLPLFLMIMFLSCLFTIPPVITVMNTEMTSINQAIPSQSSDIAVRVAIYDEDNTTTPVGPSTSLSGFTNHISEIQTLLEDAGHEVTLITAEDIKDHELITANYDVFILMNNVPRENIADLVKEFWLGGGGLFTFHKALSYLCYQGIIYPGLTADPYMLLWGNITCEEFNIDARHPSMKDYHINDTIAEREYDWSTIHKSGFNNSDVWAYVTPLMSNITDSDYIAGFAMESRYEGGRLVHLPGDGSSIPAAFESIIVDSVEWLQPRIKGRIAIDLSHQPRIGVDSWDSDYITVWTDTNNFGQFRTLAVNHSYAVDKFYPSSTGNFTANRLAGYDVLVLPWPDLNYTTAERSAIEEWVAGGGSLLVLGDRHGLPGPNPGDLAINMLLQDFDMSLGTSYIMDITSMDPGTHVTLERCTSLYMGPRNQLTVIGNATAIWLNGTNPVVAAQEYGEGRAILSADMNIFDNSELPEESNTRFALNVLNWLTASDAEILVFTDYNYYSNTMTDAVCIALLDLGIPFQLFETSEYIDDFVDSKSWELFILNEVNWGLTYLELDSIYAYVDDGGKLLMSYYDMDAHPSHPLWSKLGVEYSATITGSPTIYVWAETHPIFTEPNDFSMSNFTSGTGISDDGDSVTVKTGYTALAGTTTSVEAGAAAIVISKDRQTLFNPFLIDNFITDNDDSTYQDRIELWQNEIICMTTEFSGLPFNLDVTTLLIIGAVVVLLLVIGAVLLKRRGRSSPTSKKKPTKKKK